jgi:serine/threonine protein phosphatase PrpC
MKIQIPFALNEQGRRTNNEDSIFPQKGKATADDRFFLVCDGMGGHENGEVASQSVCNSFAVFLKRVKPEEFNEDVFKRTLAFAYDELDQKDADNITGRKMGTTLTFLFLNYKRVFAAHIGDSRIYHLRKNESGEVKIVYKSTDHSLVGELLQAGIITEEEAAVHPKKNVITRAMQPHLDKRCEATIYTTKNVRKGDMFFLCSDGVTESVNDETLCRIVAEQADGASIINTIKTLCEANSKDNFSAYLVPVEEGIESNGEIEIVADSPVEKMPSMGKQITAKKTIINRRKPKKNKTKRYLWIIILLLLAVGVAFLYFNHRSKNDKDDNDKTNPVPTERTHKSDTDRTTRDNTSQPNGQEGNKIKEESSKQLDATTSQTEVENDPNTNQSKTTSAKDFAKAQKLDSANNQSNNQSTK